jgi:NADPH2:quinone reductase
MGGYTEYHTLPADALVAVPADLDTQLAAAVPLDYLTAVSILERHLSARPADTVLIHGATGGVGDALCQLGTRMGLTMYGTASENSIARLSRYPVVPINYHSDVSETVRQHCPTGVRAVFDHLGGASLRSSYRLLAPGGVLVSYAFTGRPGHILADTVRGGLHNKILGLRPGRRTAICTLPSEIKTNPTWYRDCLSRLFDMAVRGEIEPRIGTHYPLTDAANAHTALEQRRVHGKIVLLT